MLNPRIKFLGGCCYEEIISCVSDNIPIMIQTNDHVTYDDHWIIAHGYFQSRVDGNYVIINDGRRHNNVWVEPNGTFIATVGFAN